MLCDFSVKLKREITAIKKQAEHDLQKVVTVFQSKVPGLNFSFSSQQPQVRIADQNQSMPTDSDATFGRDSSKENLSTKEVETSTLRSYGNFTRESYRPEYKNGLVGNA